MVRSVTPLIVRANNAPNLRARCVLGMGASGGDGEHEGIELGGVGFEVAGGRGRARVPDNPLGGDKVVVRGLVDPADVMPRAA